MRRVLSLLLSRFTVGQFSRLSRFTVGQFSRPFPVSLLGSSPALSRFTVGQFSAS